VLLRNDEWDYAREFISMSSVLDDERREAFLQALQSLYEEQKEGERREREDKARQEEQLRRDLEEARRLRAENEAIERRRLEEERARRTAAAREVDYGIEERTPSVAGSSRSGSGGKRHARGKESKGSVAGTRKLSSTSKSGKEVVAKPSLTSRAAMVLGNLRALVEHLGGSFAGSPYMLLRTLAFIVGLLLVFSRRNIRERIARVLGNSWGKIRATAGMGVKVSYI
jgi:hypothetical protein